MTRRRAVIICGPTATGKTDLAMRIARTHNGEMVNADSRQIITGCDIISGKDIPSGVKPIFRRRITIRGESFRLITYDMGGSVMWLYDAVQPEKEISVSHYRALAEMVIGDILARGKLPVIVGGTGFYLEALVRSPDTINIPRDSSLRKELEGATLEVLQKKTEAANPVRWGAMNDSDRYNPRRLVRAIETGMWDATHLSAGVTREVVTDPFWIGLKPDPETYRSKLRARVEERFKRGALGEAATLSDADHAAVQKSLLGVDVLLQVIRGEISQETALDLWTAEEFRYAKRQLTWFKKNPDIRWFGGSRAYAPDDIEKALRQWYT